MWYGCSLTRAGILAVLAAPLVLVSRQAAQAQPAAPLSWHSLRSGTQAELAGVTCPTTLVCAAVGSDWTILHTADGGRSWQREHSPVTTDNSAQGWRAIACPGAQVCFVVGDQGAIANTSDGGRHWRADPSDVETIAGFTPYLYSLSCLSARSCAAIGDESTILVTHDGGASWHVSHYANNTSDSLSTVACPAGHACYAGGILEGAEVVFTTGDAGRSWRRASAAPPVAKRFPATDLSADADNYWSVDQLACPTLHICAAVGSHTTAYHDGSTTEAGLFITTDGGHTWRDRTPPSRLGYPAQALIVACPSASTCYVTDGDTQATYTTTGGRSWVPLPDLPSGALMTALACPAPRLCYGVGLSGAILQLS